MDHPPASSHDQRDCELRERAPWSEAFGVSVGWMSPCFFHSPRSSAVRGRSPGRVPSAVLLRGMTQPSNHGALEQGSMWSPASVTVLCLRALFNT